MKCIPQLSSRKSRNSPKQLYATIRQHRRSAEKGGRGCTSYTCRPYTIRRSIALCLRRNSQQYPFRPTAEQHQFCNVRSVEPRFTFSKVGGIKLYRFFFIEHTVPYDKNWMAATVISLLKRNTKKSKSSRQ